MSGWQEEAREVTRQTIHDHWCDETPCTVTDADYEGSDEQALADAILDALAPVVAAEVARAEARGKVAALRGSVPLPPNPSPLRIGLPSLPAEDTRHPGRLVVLWCVLTLRHRGHVGSGREGVYWQCVRCTARIVAGESRG